MLQERRYGSPHEVMNPIQLKVRGSHKRQRKKEIIDTNQASRPALEMRPVAVIFVSLNHFLSPFYPLLPYKTSGDSSFR